MTAGTVTPHQPDQQTGRDGFAPLLRAEWTKFRTVRGWVIAMIVAALATVGFGLLGQDSCGTVNNAACTVPLGPGGEAGLPFSEVSAHRASLEEAYLELTRDAVEFRAAADPEVAR